MSRKLAPANVASDIFTVWSGITYNTWGLIAVLMKDFKLLPEADSVGNFAVTVWSSRHVPTVWNMFELRDTRQSLFRDSPPACLLLLETWVTARPSACWESETTDCDDQTLEVSEVSDSDKWPSGFEAEGPVVGERSSLAYFTLFCTWKVSAWLKLRHLPDKKTSRLLAINQSQQS